MATLIEMVSEIVSSHASATSMSSDELLSELQRVHAALKAIESGQPVDAAQVKEKPALTVKEAFKKNEVVCMVCGKGGFKTLTRHINDAHGLKPGQYRKQFGIPSGQSLTAKSYSESRRKMALDRGLADNLAKARETRAAKIAAGKAPAKTVKPAKAAAAAKTVKPAKVAKPVKATAKPAQKATAAAKTTAKAPDKAKAPVKATKAKSPAKTAKASTEPKS